ncbi:MAG: chromosomal replication initiator protein DnaA [Alphaproteobacteria bacterium]|nr:MAG: chromosomal replication initiator protein DnaA [Alphaproteobacteria bacterium]
MPNPWPEIAFLLQKKFGKVTFDSWLSDIFFVEFVAGRLVLAAPTRFVRDWFVTNCERDALACAKEVDSRILLLDVIVRSAQSQLSASPPDADSKTNTARAKDSPSAGEDEWKSVENIFTTSALDARFTFENFVVGKPNELAYAAARRVAEAETVPFNPLFLYGGVGLGKTHLMHAIAWQLRSSHPDRKVIYMSAEKFMYQFIRALRFKDTVAFKEQFRSVDILMIDDVQFISGKDSTQEEFFHTFNALVDQNRQVVISADKSPSDLEGMEERLKSRLGWGLVADVHPTTYELRLGILQAKAEKLTVTVPDSVIEFLAHKISSNVRELEGALTRIVAHATLVGRALNMDMAQDVLRDLLRANERLVTAEEVQKKVAEHFNVRVSDMHSSRRLRTVVRPRQVAMYLTKNLTPLSLPEIGRKFGGRDHTTVLHAVKKVEELISKDPSLKEDIDLLKRLLSS